MSYAMIMSIRASATILPDLKHTARMLCTEIHRKAFATKIDLSQVDIHSPAVASGDSSQIGLRKLFGTK